CVPFDGPTPTAIYERQRKAPPSLGSISSVSQAAAAAVHQALALDPSHRFETCSAFAHAVLGAAPHFLADSHKRPLTGRGATGSPYSPGTLVEEASASCPQCGKQLRVPAKALG